MLSCLGDPARNPLGRLRRIQLIVDVLLVHTPLVLADGVVGMADDVDFGGGDVADGGAVLGVAEDED